MKRLFLLSAIIFFGFIKINAQVNVSISFQNFYDELSPYGAWIEYPGEGYVWSPYEGADFRPYGSRGHWAYTEEGWAWVSNYEWGWAPFHYGKWIYDDVRGWLWVPGYEWAPAWVTWGYYDNCYGWAPLGVDFRADYVSYRPPAAWWMFVGAAYITSTSWHSHVYGGWSARPRTTIINNTTIVNNNIRVINNVRNSGSTGAWARGPQANDVQKFTHTSIRPIAITAASKPGADRIKSGHLAMFRPVVNRSSANNVKPAHTENFERFRPTTRTANPNNNPSANTTRPNSNAETNKPANRNHNVQSNPPVNHADNPERRIPDNNHAQPNHPPTNQANNPPHNNVRQMQKENPQQTQHNNQQRVQPRPRQTTRPANQPPRQVPRPAPPPEKKHTGR